MVDVIMLDECNSLSPGNSFKSSGTSRGSQTVFKCSRAVWANDRSEHANFVLLFGNEKGKESAALSHDLVQLKDGQED
jgi:hypothetical protein